MIAVANCVSVSLETLYKDTVNVIIKIGEVKFDSFLWNYGREPEESFFRNLDIHAKIAIKEREGYLQRMGFEPKRVSLLEE